MSLSCSVCGTTKSSIYIGHGDSDLLCSACDDWLMFTPEEERFADERRRLSRMLDADEGEGSE